MQGILIVFHVDCGVGGRKAGGAGGIHALALGEDAVGVAFAGGVVQLEDIHAAVIIHMVIGDLAGGDGGSGDLGKGHPGEETVAGLVIDRRLGSHIQAAQLAFRGPPSPGGDVFDHSGQTEMAALKGGHAGQTAGGALHGGGGGGDLTLHSKAIRQLHRGLIAGFAVAGDGGNADGLAGHSVGRDHPGHIVIAVQQEGHAVAQFEAGQILQGAVQNIELGAHDGDGAGAHRAGAGVFIDAGELAVGEVEHVRAAVKAAHVVGLDVAQSGGNTVFIDGGSDRGE